MSYWQTAFFMAVGLHVAGYGVGLLIHSVRRRTENENNH